MTDSIPLTSKGVPDKRYAPPEPAETPSVVSPIRARERQMRVGVEIPNPEKGRHYGWKAVDSGHFQSSASAEQYGWEIVPRRKAGKLGLRGYVNPITDEQVVEDVGGGILFGNTVLMDCSDDVWFALCDEKLAPNSALDELMTNVKGQIDDVQAQADYITGRRH